MDYCCAGETDAAKVEEIVMTVVSNITTEATPKSELANEWLPRDLQHHVSMPYSFVVTPCTYNQYKLSALRVRTGGLTLAQANDPNCHLCFH